MVNYSRRKAARSHQGWQGPLAFTGNSCHLTVKSNNGVVPNKWRLRRYSDHGCYVSSDTMAVAPQEFFLLSLWWHHKENPQHCKKLFYTITWLSQVTKYSKKKGDLSLQTATLTAHVYSGGCRMTSLALQWCWVEATSVLASRLSLLKVTPCHQNIQKKKWLEEVYKISCADSSCLLVLNMVLLAGRRGEHLHHRGKQATFEHGTAGCYQRHL